MSLLFQDIVLEVLDTPDNMWQGANQSKESDSQEDGPSKAQVQHSYRKGVIAALIFNPGYLFPE